MVDVVVTGVGLLSALGDELSTTWDALLAGRSAIALRQPFLSAPILPLAMMGKTPADFRDLVTRAVLMAMQDAALLPPLTDCGIVLGSSRSNIRDSEHLAQTYGEAGQLPPSGWMAALPHQGALLAAHLAGSQGPVLAPMAACATGIWALAQAYELIQTGQCERVIAGAVEAPITPLCLAGFAKMGAQAKTGCYPFDKDREGLVLGEGAAMVVMETARAARQRGVLPYGRVLGFGLLNDAYHVSAPQPNYGVALSTVRTCLKRSQLAAHQIGYIHAHGTSTRLNDQMESAIVQTLFPQNPPISSTKGATGHTLGASGAIGVALSLMVLRHQVLPPCVGLKTSAFDLNLLRQAQAAQLEYALCCSFGFGGQNAIVALGLAD